MNHTICQFVKKVLSFALGVFLNFLVVCSWTASPVALAAGSYVIEEIIVTAQKREENIQSVPISISSMSGDQLNDVKISNVVNLGSQIPGMQVTSPWGDALPIFSLRGISAVDYSQNQSSPVALYVDEVYKGLPVFNSLQLFDVERVEVLRGPQGTLYGKNTTGGAVNFRTIGASLTDGLSGYINAGLGNLDRWEVAGAINVPVIDDVLATRVAFSVTNVDGYVKNFSPGEKDQASVDSWAIRWSTNWKPTDNLDIDLRLTTTKSTPTGNGVITTNIGASGVGFGTGYHREGLSFFENESEITGEHRIKNSSISLKMTWDVTNDMALTSVTSFDDGKWTLVEDCDGSPFNICSGDYVTDGREWSQDLRLASTGEGRLQWLIGLYAYDDTVKNSQNLRYYHSFAFLDAGGVPFCFTDFFTGCTYSNNFRQDRKSFAAYTQENYKVTDALSLTFGLRYTDDQNDIKYYHAGFGFLDPVTGTEFLNIAPLITAPPVDSLDSSYVDFKVGVEYQWEDETLLYASFSRGHRGGAFNGQALNAPEEVTTAEPEKLDSYEIGVKTQTWEDRLRLHGAIFYYDYKNQQFIDLDGFLQVLYSAPKSRLYGGELELTAVPTAGLDIRLGISYLDAEYREAALQGQDVSGNTLILAPEWTINADVQWQFATTSFGTFSLGYNSRYTSKLYYDAFNTDAIVQPGYWIHNARLTFEASNMPIKVSAWVTNLGDEEYLLYRLNVVDFFNYDYGQRGRPREFGIDFQYTF